MVVKGNLEVVERCQKGNRGYIVQARVQGGGAQGAGAPLEIIKKKSSEQILSYFTYILLLF